MSGSVASTSPLTLVPFVVQKPGRFCSTWSSMIRESVRSSGGTMKGECVEKTTWCFGRSRSAKYRSRSAWALPWRVSPGSSSRSIWLPPRLLTCANFTRNEKNQMNPALRSENGTVTL
ncbi:hypothetical protein CHKEEEPN_3852 [Methylorubrum podarium]|nr:hypothetical protein CHKEEEPN_3852 [Methylorubrum podarium]